MTSSDSRPLAALGHAQMQTRNVEPTARRLEAIGVRPIVVREGLAVMELRGGTHIVIREAKDDAQQEAPFDLMYDDIDQAHRLLARSGFEVTDIERGEIHDSFWGAAPEGFRIRINSSHASDRPV